MMLNALECEIYCTRCGQWSSHCTFPRCAKLEPRVQRSVFAIAEDLANGGS